MDVVDMDNYIKLWGKNLSNYLVVVRTWALGTLARPNSISSFSSNRTSRFLKDFRPPQFLQLPERTVYFSSNEIGQEGMEHVALPQESGFWAGACHVTRKSSKNIWQFFPNFHLLPVS
jgi:hypothetical protein